MVTQNVLRIAAGFIRGAVRFRLVQIRY
jgi:hypothetical protein